MIGLSSGVIGFIFTYIISAVINVVVGSTIVIYRLASLPFWTTLILVIVSIILTLISGLIPALIASRKDSVVALRTD